MALPGRDVLHLMCMGKHQLTYSAGIKKAQPRATEGLTGVCCAYVSYAIKMPWLEDDIGRSYSGL